MALIYKNVSYKLISFPNTKVLMKYNFHQTVTGILWYEYLPTPESKFSNQKKNRNFNKNSNK